MDVSASTQARSEVKWRERLARFAAGGQTVKQFCQAESISAWSFYRWRKQLTPSAGAARPAGFIDVGAMPPPAARPEAQAAAPAAGVEVRLDLGHGLVLHIVRP